MSDTPVFAFDDFRLDARERCLWGAGERLELPGRHFDVLLLLVADAGRLVTKERFLAEVWGEVIVTDAALTQCIKAIRRTLGDEAGQPRYIETVPRHGYRFVAEVRVEEGAASPPLVLAPEPDAPPPRPPDADTPVPFPHPALSATLPHADATAFVVAGGIGGALAGVIGGLTYGSLVIWAGRGEGLGTSSVLVVLVAVNVALGFVAGFGVSLGSVVMSSLAGERSAWRVLGAAVGGCLVGAVAQLVGRDAFALFIGTTPAAFTGALEGLALGAALAWGARLGLRARGRWPRVSPRTSAVIGAAGAGALAGALIPLLGGRLMGGSLAAVGEAFSRSHLQLAVLGQWFGDAGFGMSSQALLGAVEGAVFAACVVGAGGFRGRASSGRG